MQRSSGSPCPVQGLFGGEEVKTSFVWKYTPAEVLVTALKSVSSPLDPSGQLEIWSSSNWAQ